MSASTSAGVDGVTLLVTTTEDPASVNLANALFERVSRHRGGHITWHAYRPFVDISKADATRCLHAGRVG
jgi:hypothetical protein